MILKLLERSPLMDSDPQKPCRILDAVNEVRFYTLMTGEAALDVQYDKANRGLESETFVLNANAYLMNSAGKTVQAFSPATKTDG